MSERYNFSEIEVKWQQKWDRENTFRTMESTDKEKYYVLEMFPYPSGKLHMGHVRNYSIGDVIARFKTMNGYNVLHPMGWDSFGLPAENAAIKNGIHPNIWTWSNIDEMRKQLKQLGFSYDWSREVATCHPDYYRWMQWIFIQFFKKGLAYKKENPVNWCPSCQTVLANEQVVDGGCERCGSPVIRKEKSQWMLKITAYAQELIDGLEGLDFIDRVKTQQINWIGRSTGAEVDFNTTEGDKLTVFTTRPDTLFGATYMVISPEHPYVKKWADKLSNLSEVEDYVAAAARKSDFERSELAADKEKTGVELLGVRGINPVNGREVPIFISDYVLVTYGTGAIMAVPAHDGRDWEFAKKFGLPIIEVVAGGNVEEAAFTLKDDTGIMVNSGFMNGMTVKEAIPAMIKWLGVQGLGYKKVNYKLRDWVFSRQRYWGEPIPMVWCDKCGWVPLEEHELPVLLPDVESYEPTDTGESPLSKMTDWVNTTCPRCGGAAKRETDTMPQWAGSSWYFLRYADPHNAEALASQEALDYWTPVDWYNGGMEHTTLHLLYSRFWNHFLYDIGVVPTAEPYKKRTSHGMILGEGGEKMSKSRGNVVNPNDVIAEFGADTMRLYIMFIGDFEKAAAWSSNAVKGCKRFLDRVWNLADLATDAPEYSAANEGAIHKAIKKVSDDIEAMKFNTAIAALMALVNDFYANGLTKGDLRTLLLMLSPFAPHLVEELWEELGFTAGHGMACTQPWPAYDAAKTVDAEVNMAVQVGGKLRGTVAMPVDSAQDAVVATALADPKVAKFTEGMEIVKVIHVPNKLVNLIVKPKA